MSNELVDTEDKLKADTKNRTNEDNGAHIRS